MLRIVALVLLLPLSACNLTHLYFARCTETHPQGTPDVRDTDELRDSHVAAANDAAAFVKAHPEYACIVMRQTAR